MANFNPSWKAEVGLNNVGAYQVSGQPYAIGGLACNNATKIEFPFVTRWVQIHVDAGPVRVGFSEIGVSGSNYFRVSSGSSSEILELKVSELWLYGLGVAEAEVEVVAGLTSIPSTRTSMGTGRPSWSGSSGVG